MITKYAVVVGQAVGIVTAEEMKEIVTSAPAAGTRFLVSEDGVERKIAVEELRVKLGVHYAGRVAVCRELMSTFGCGFQTAKTLYEHSYDPEPDRIKMIRVGSPRKRPMFAKEAARHVAAARERIRLVDSGG